MFDNRKYLLRRIREPVNSENYIESNVRFGSVAVVQADISLTAAFGRKAVTRGQVIGIVSNHVAH